MRSRCRCELELGGRDVDCVEIPPCALQSLEVHECKPESVDVTVPPAGSLVGARAEMTVSTHHAAQVAAPVVRVMERRIRESTEADQVVVGREEWTAVASVLRSGDV